MSFDIKEVRAKLSACESVSNEELAEILSAYEQLVTTINAIDDPAHMLFLKDLRDDLNMMKSMSKNRMAEKSEQGNDQ